MKILREVLWVIFLAAVFYAFFNGPPLVHGQTIEYVYTEVKQPGTPQDLNVHGDVLLTNYPQPGGTMLTKKAKTPATFKCHETQFDETQAKRLDNQGNITGDCTDDGTQHAKVVGFVRDKQGKLSFLDVPGSTATQGNAINGDLACGLYFGPLQPTQSGYAIMHGFCRDRSGYQTEDVPMPYSVTVISGVNRKGKQVGRVFVYDPVTNETSNPMGFLKDNGNYTSLAVPKADWTDPLDINSWDDVLLDSSLGNIILSDGIYFRIGSPPADPGLTVISLDVSGFNDDLGIVGTYAQKQAGCVATLERPCQITVKNFVAVPK